MRKCGAGAADRVAALELEVESKFREVCAAVSRERPGNGSWNMQPDLKKLHREALDEARSVQGHATREDQARRQHDEVRTLAGEAAALRAHAGAAIESFRQRFEKVKERLDGKALLTAAIHRRGVLHSSCESLYAFILHLLATPGLLDDARYGCASLESRDDSLRSLSQRNVDREPGYWLRVDAMLDVVEEVGRGFTIEQIQTFADLDIAERRFEQRVTDYSRHYEGRPWQEWPDIWSMSKQQKRADNAFAVFARAFLAARAYEDLDPRTEADVRWVCRQYDQAQDRLTIARLEERVEAVEMKLARQKPTRPERVALRAKSGSTTKRKGGAK